MITKKCETSNRVALRSGVATMLNLSGSKSRPLFRCFQSDKKIPPPQISTEDNFIGVWFGKGT